MRPAPSGLRWVALGALFLFGAWGTLFLMVVRWIPPQLELALAAYAASVAGLAIGLWGLVQYVRSR